MSKESFPTIKELIDWVFDVILPGLFINPEFSWPEDHWAQWSRGWDINIYHDEENNFISVYPVTGFGTDTGKAIIIYKVRR